MTSASLQLIRKPIVENVRSDLQKRAAQVVHTSQIVVARAPFGNDLVEGSHIGIMVGTASHQNVLATTSIHLLYAKSSDQHVAAIAALQIIFLVGAADQHIVAVVALQLVLAGSTQQDVSTATAL